MPTNHDTIFCIASSTVLLPLLGSGFAINCIRHIIEMAEIVSTSLAISAIFRLSGAVTRRKATLKNVTVLSVFGSK